MSRLQANCPGRIIGTVKRSTAENDGVKARGVKQGFKENLLEADGEDFNYYSHVAKLTSVRSTLFRPRRRSRRIAIRDVSTAFLQSRRYEGFVKYVTFKNPLTKEWEYYRQLGPIYGEASAPVRWENTITPWLTDEDQKDPEVEPPMGFTRGDNEPSVFYHEEKDLLVLLYVDDVLVDGEEADVKWFFDRLGDRFQCKEEEWLSEQSPLDYLGMEIIQKDGRLHLSMYKYIQSMLKALTWDTLSTARAHTPISAPIEGGTPLNASQRKTFMTAVGCVGWLVNTGRPDVAYAASRIAQHLANPTTSALNAIKRVCAYLKRTAHLSLSVVIDQDDMDIDPAAAASSDIQFTDDWEFYCDSDFAGNTEVQNARRSQNGYIALSGGAPVYWTSKVSSVAFAHPAIGEAHADVSSGAAEVYASGNAANDFLYLSYTAGECGLDFPQPLVL